ncbi:unnamed protein product [Pelagomonas calceolata]|uniref:Uncharacterized protein n=2 Tax=Pelagomonas calceolata TaxID=35677 RepID=A0A8J2SGJ2_9STRA|nr:unnamed protein product [Pelagomonas calceolata]
MACCNLASCVQAALAGLRLPDEPAPGGMMDESDGDEAAPEVAEETAPTPAADDWGPKWKRKMRAQLPTQHELNVEVMRAAANSPAKGILRMLAFYAGHHLTVDQIARSVLVPPGHVEELLYHLYSYGHVAEHSAGGVTTYSARSDALERYLTSRDDADRAATPTPALAPAPAIMARLGEMWDALDGAARKRYGDDAPMVRVGTKKPRSAARARSATPTPPPDSDAPTATVDDEVADKWARGELQVEHIEPCALVFKSKGPFVDADGNFTEAARYLNRLANLQLMDAHKNNVKDANFSGVTRRALEERERLLAGCDLSTEVGFKKHLDALRVHVITVSEIGAKDEKFRGEKYF